MDLRDELAEEIAAIITAATGVEVDGDGDPWTIVCERLTDVFREILGAPELCELCNGSRWVSWEEPNRAGGIDIKGMECSACGEKLQLSGAFVAIEGEDAS